MKFRSSIGSARDLKELEYVVALHQTSHDDEKAWIDGSIDGKIFLIYFF